MIKIYLTGTFHFNCLSDVFSGTAQTELEKITDIFSSWSFSVKEPPAQPVE